MLFIEYLMDNQLHFSNYLLHKYCNNLLVNINNLNYLNNKILKVFKKILKKSEEV